MNIPKKIEKLLDKREKLAMELLSVNKELDDWLENKGADLTDASICDGVLSGCMIYCEPWTAKMIVRDYIKNEL